MDSIIYLDGTLIPRNRAWISPFDHGFLYGYGLFETMRAYSGRIFRLHRHLVRFAQSARSLDIPLAGFDFEKACSDTLRANYLDDARVRITVSMGEGEGTPDPPPHPRPTVFIIATKYIPLPDEVYRSGFTALVSSIRQNSQSPLSGIKSTNYLNNLLARREARSRGAHEAILLNERGFLCEGSTSNIFLVSRGSLVTPSEESGPLPGITREAVLELAHDLGINAVQREVRLEELQAAEEAFLTNSLMGIMPIREADGTPIGAISTEKTPGKITGRLMNAYRALVTKETQPGI